MMTAEMSHVPHIPCAMLSTLAMCVSVVFSDKLAGGQTSVFIVHTNTSL